MNIEDAQKRMGFYTKKFVEAENEESAELAAVELIRKDEKLRNCILNERADPPMIYAEEIDEVASFVADDGRWLKDGPPGFTFFDEEPSDA